MRSREDAERAASYQRRLDELMSSGTVCKEELAEALKTLDCYIDSYKMAYSKVILHWWQVVSAARIVKRVCAGEDAGVILADQVGLGKTMVALAVILRLGLDQMQAWSEAVAAGGPEAATKLLPQPYLILVPATLVRQWTEEIKKFGDHLLCAFVYYGDRRQRAAAEHGERIYDVLTPKSRELQFCNAAIKGRKATPRIRVIVCSHETWRNRHGPNALKREARQWDNTKTGNARMAPPRREDKWQHDMTDVFRLVVVDEAHVICGECGHINQSISWLGKRCFRPATHDSDAHLVAPLRPDRPAPHGGAGRILGAGGDGAGRHRPLVPPRRRLPPRVPLQRVRIQPVLRGADLDAPRHPVAPRDPGPVPEHVAPRGGGGDGHRGRHGRPLVRRLRPEPGASVTAARRPRALGPAAGLPNAAAGRRAHWREHA
jgi:hypothetical protein